MRNTRFIALTFLMLAACGPPVGDPSQEIMENSNGVVGKAVPLKTSPSLKSGSLVDASQAWLGSGWKEIDAAFCKSMMANELTPISAFELDDYSVVSKDQKTYQAYTFRICALQLENPKTISALGFVASATKPTPIKP